HREERLDLETLGADELRDLPGVLRRPVAPGLIQIARVEESRARQVREHHAFARLATHRVELDAVRALAEKDAARHPVELRRPRAPFERVGVASVPALERAADLRLVPVEQVDGDAACGVLADAAEMRPGVRGRHDGLDRSARETPRGLSED